MNQLRESTAENAKTAAEEVKAQEAVQPEGATIQPPPAAKNAFARSPAAHDVGRPSFVPPTQSPQAPAAAPSSAATPGRPSFGRPEAPAAPAPASRPSFGNSSSLPSVRGAFVKDPSKLGSTPSASPASASANMTPQALFEIVCTHRKLSQSAIEAAKAQASENPDAVLAQMRRIYDQEIAPTRTRHSSDLPTARDTHPDKIVFLLRKDDKERIRVMTREEASSTGEILLDGASVENIHAAASPFMSPSQLFSSPAPQDPTAQVETIPEPSVSRSPKP